ncbi:MULTISPECIES: DUF1385 domain-containing protein [Carboxydothermus]|uniref:Uncharacterized protein YqhQ n=2 Tax=Carboxydothermus TaxID=129957 RepID=A0ABX2RCU5_9THEO|nr:MULTISPECIES: DUF1385 domain-containing protein [Carboxydothermus]ABB14494.1 putative membrane protein [Carboxydothermus hydrogenoformans Z-2901]NYE57700.1 uncharacterized protein YqhQ [Carboxydothermus ferrireducens DSM 11255]
MKFNYGGQAVIEGVMMRGPEKWAVAVRTPSGKIVIEERPLASALNTPFFKLPFIRGLVALYDALVLGIEALVYSANQAVEEEGEKLSKSELGLSMILAFAVGIGLFVVLPTWAAHASAPVIKAYWAQNLVEGIIRVILFFLYVWAIGRMEDIERVFAYHGAEHKTIHAYEAGDELTVERVRKYTTLHPRCGTSFLLIVMVVSILIFSLLGDQNLLWRIFSRILLIPVVAGVSYEVLKGSAKISHTLLGKILTAPGLWLQKLTTREPDDSMLEVAITSLKAVIKDEVKS